MITTFKYKEIRELIEQAGFYISYEDSTSIIKKISDGRINHPADEAIVQAIINNYTHLPVLKTDKIAELKDEAVKRMALVYSFIDDPDYYLFLRDIYTTIKPQSRDPLSGNLLQIKDIKDAFDAAKTAVNAMTTDAEVLAYDVVNSPVWPV